MSGLHDIAKKDFERLLKKNGFTFDRAGKHHVWKRLSDGAIIPMPMGPKVSAPVARKMVKQYHLTGAPYGWSELAEKSEAKAEQREQERRDAAEANRKALERAKTAIAAEQEGQKPSAPTEEEKSKPAAAPAEIESNTTPKTQIYMNEKRLANFHEYLCAVVDYYHKNGKILKNFSFLAKQYRVKGITQDDFKNYKLSDLKPNEKPTRKLSDTIRLSMAEQDMSARRQMLDNYLKEQELREAAGQQEPPHEPTLAERIDTFEARFDLMGPVFANISSQLNEYYKKEFGPNADGLLGQDSWKVRMSPEPYLTEWANNVEFDLTRLVFDNADPDEVRQMLPSWNDKILHAYLTWLYGGKDGTQMKLNFDERGCADSQNEALVDLLRDQGLLDQMLYVKLESWKGCAHCVAVYNDAPDVLMVIGEGGADFYTIADDIWYSFGGDTIINPDVVAEFGGWGTRSIVGFCLRHLLKEENHKAAIQEQQKVTKQMRGKLMDDINHYRDIWQMYHDEDMKQQRKGMIDFG